MKCPNLHVFSLKNKKKKHFKMSAEIYPACLDLNISFLFQIIYCPLTWFTLENGSLFSAIYGQEHL